MTNSSLAAAVSVVLLVVTSSCNSTPGGAWVEGDVPTVSDTVLWEMTRRAFRREGFPQTEPGFGPVDHTAKSGWRTKLAPFSGQGFRERVWVKYSKAGAGGLALKVRVEREVNKNRARPLDPQHADWERASDSVERARFILQNIKSALFINIPR